MSDDPDRHEASPDLLGGASFIGRQRIGLTRAGSGDGRTKHDIAVHGGSVRSQALLLRDRPVPLLLVSIPGGEQWFTPPIDWREMLRQIDRSLLLCEFRGIAVQRLPVVFRNGIDVEPVDAPIFVADFDKAWEYGGWPKVMLALESFRLQPTYREVHANINPEELAVLRLRYPTMRESLDHTRLWLSKLPDGDPRIASEYEKVYARWIEGDPFDTLRAIFIFARPEDSRDLTAIAKQAG